MSRFVSCRGPPAAGDVGDAVVAACMAGPSALQMLSPSPAPHSSDSAVSMTSTRKSASSMLKHIGGLRPIQNEGRWCIQQCACCTEVHATRLSLEATSQHGTLPVDRLGVGRHPVVNTPQHHRGSGGHAAGPLNASQAVGGAHDAEAAAVQPALAHEHAQVLHALHGRCHLRARRLLQGDNE